MLEIIKFNFAHRHSILHLVNTQKLPYNDIIGRDIKIMYTLISLNETVCATKL